MPTDLLRCPACGGGLRPGDGHLDCPTGHTFDVARQGYVNLLAGASARPPGDSQAMVRARVEFLAAGHYAHLDAALAEIVRSLGLAGGVIVDAGSGPGHHLAVVLDAAPDAVGLAIDASKFAALRAARAHARAAAVVWDTWQPWPVRGDVASLVINVLAPRNGDEFRRVLRPDGVLVVVTPADDHLAELVEDLELLSVDADKDERLERGLGRHFERQERRVHRSTLRLAPDDLRRLVRMGPSSSHVDETALERGLAALPTPATVTAAFTVTVYRPRHADGKQPSSPPTPPASAPGG